MKVVLSKLMKSITRENWSSQSGESLNIYKTFQLIGSWRSLVLTMTPGRNSRDKWKLSDRKVRLFWRAVFLTTAVKNQRDSLNWWVK